MSKELYLGLMSGTSLDGIDGVLIAIDQSGWTILSKADIAFPQLLRDQLLTLQQPSDNELHHEALAANALTKLYANCVTKVLTYANISPNQIRALAAHGQTIRHQPGLHDGIGYSKQTLAPALLAELTGIDVVADFRSRDIAAHGQGAPLVPAFHQYVFGNAKEARVICNIGGITNLTILSTDCFAHPETILGFDCGPGNVLLDYWAQKHLGTAYDAQGEWAAGGKVNLIFLKQLMQEPFIRKAPPKSTGRDLFNPDWLVNHYQKSQEIFIAPQDIQTTLTYYTAQCITQAAVQYGHSAKTLILCGGGTFNTYLIRLLKEALPTWRILLTDDFGIPTQNVEACAFAWLAWRFIHSLPGNLPSATGATGPRVLGALYPH